MGFYKNHCRHRCVMMLPAGVETTTVDVHAVPVVHATHHSYGAVDNHSSPPAVVISEVVLADSDVECNDTEHSVTAVDDRPHVSNASVQHSSNAVLVSVDLPPPDQSTI